MMTIVMDVDVTSDDVFMTALTSPVERDDYDYEHFTAIADLEFFVFLTNPPFTSHFSSL